MRRQPRARPLAPSVRSVLHPVVAAGAVLTLVGASCGPTRQLLDDAVRGACNVLDNGTVPGAPRVPGAPGVPRPIPPGTTLGGVEQASPAPPVPRVRPADVILAPTPEAAVEAAVLNYGGPALEPLRTKALATDLLEAENGGDIVELVAVTSICGAVDV